MAIDLEKQFFDTFGITYLCRFQYPDITDTHYLELICLITKELNYFTNFSTNSEHLKEYILKEMILHKEDFSKSQVLELFKE